MFSQGVQKNTTGNRFPHSTKELKVKSSTNVSIDLNTNFYLSYDLRFAISFRTP